MFLIDVELIFFFFDVDSIEEDRMVYQNESPLAICIWLSTFSILR